MKTHNSKLIVTVLGLCSLTVAYSQGTSNPNLVYNGRRTSNTVGVLSSTTTTSGGNETTTYEFGRKTETENTIFLLGPTYQHTNQQSSEGMEGNMNYLKNKIAEFELRTEGSGRNAKKYFYVYISDDGSYEIIQLDRAGRNIIANIWGAIGSARNASPARGLTPTWFAPQLQSQGRYAYAWGMSSYPTPTPGSQTSYTSSYRIDPNLTALVYNKDFEDAVKAIRDDLIKKGYEEKKLENWEVEE